MALSRELAVEEAMNLSQDRIRDDDDDPSTERHTSLYRRRDMYSADSKQTATDGDSKICRLTISTTFISLYSTKLKLNSVALVRERTIPTERPPPVGEVSANFCG